MAYKSLKVSIHVDAQRLLSTDAKTFPLRFPALAPVGQTGDAPVDDELKATRSIASVCYGGSRLVFLCADWGSRKDQILRCRHVLMLAKVGKLIAFDARNLRFALNANLRPQALVLPRGSPHPCFSVES